MIPRHLSNVLRRAASNYPVVTITGPRQSGKTTLARAVFAKYAYVSLEAPDVRAFATEDPRSFLDQFRGAVVLDEVQQAPDLFSYIQSRVDDDGRPGRYVLTGSQNFLLLDKVAQSLAGRTYISHLLPFSMAELAGRRPCRVEAIGRTVPRIKSYEGSWFEAAQQGFYPRIHDRGIDANEWLTQYFQTYLERDVRSLAHVGDLESFGRFVRLCAGRSGQLLNLSSLGNDCGVSHDTARRWLSVLEASFVVFRLAPYHRNFSKRLIKSPKLYFYDTGLLCCLLQIRSSAQLETHAMRGPVFENLIVVEIAKAIFNQGDRPALYFWRDHRGDEIDLVIDTAEGAIAVEIKSGATIGSDFFKGLARWQMLTGDEGPTALVYGGDGSVKRKSAMVYSWRHWG